MLVVVVVVADRGPDRASISDHIRSAPTSVDTSLRDIPIATAPNWLSGVLVLSLIYLAKLFLSLRVRGLTIIDTLKDVRSADTSSTWLLKHGALTGHYFLIGHRV